MEQRDTEVMWWTKVTLSTDGGLCTQTSTVFPRKLETTAQAHLSPPTVLRLPVQHNLRPGVAPA